MSRMLFFWYREDEKEKMPDYFMWVCPKLIYCKKLSIEDKKQEDSPYIFLERVYKTLYPSKNWYRHGWCLSDEPIEEEIVTLDKLKDFWRGHFKKNFYENQPFDELKYFRICDDYSVHIGSQIVIRKLSESDKYYNSNCYFREFSNFFGHKYFSHNPHKKNVISNTREADMVAENEVYPVFTQNYLWLEERLSQCFDIVPCKRFTTHVRPKIEAEGFKPKVNKIKLHYYNPTIKYKPATSDIYKRTDCEKNGNLYFVGETDKGVYMKLLDEKESETWKSGDTELFLSVMSNEIKDNNVNEKCWTVTETEPEVYEMNYNGDIPDDIDRRIKGAPDYLIGFYKGKRLTLKLGKEIKLFVKEYFEVDESKIPSLLSRRPVSKSHLGIFFDEYMYGKYNFKDRPAHIYRYCCGIVGDLPEVREE